MSLEKNKTKCLIVGSGPAGYTAAIYAARADLRPILYEGLQPGGQLTTTTDVDNFPGFRDGVTGPELMAEMKEQAERFDTDIRSGIIREIDFSKRPYIATSDDGTEIEAQTIIICTGASARYLNIPSETRYKGGGVSACATCDGFFYKGLTVAVVGGGDTAAEEATYLANLAKKVYLIHRRDQLRASKAMQERVFRTENIEVLWNSTVEEVLGEESKFNKRVTGLILKNTIDHSTSTIDVDGIFIAIGHSPNTEIVKGHVELDENGYIITEKGSTKTNIPGVFAAGDVQDSYYRQGITSAGSGCMAAIDAERFLGEGGLIL